MNWAATVVGHMDAQAVVRLAGALLFIDDPDGLLPVGLETTVLAYAGEDRPAQAIDLGRFRVTLRPPLVVLDKSDTGGALAGRVVIDNAHTVSLPPNVRLWIVHPTTTTSDPKVFGAGERCPRVTPAETHLHYMLGHGPQEKTP